MEKTNCATAYFFFDFNDTAQQTAFAMVESCISQLCRICSIQNLPPIVRKLHSLHINGPMVTLDLLLEAFEALINVFPEVFIIIDALDECKGRQEQDGILGVFIRMNSWECSNLHVSVACRREQDIVEVLSFVATTQINIKGTEHEADIQAYIGHRLQHGKLKRWSREQQEPIKERISKSTGDMSAGHNVVLWQKLS